MGDPSTTASGQENAYLQRAYALSSVNGARELYDEWATSYDEQLTATDYASPQRTVEAVVANLSGRDIASKINVLDAGCGTGLVGKCFAESTLSGRITLHGLDLSEGMLAVARQGGCYGTLETADLTHPIQRPDASFSVVTCVGTLTKGHVGPKVLAEFARVTARGGLVVATVHEEIWEKLGYKSEVERLRSDGTIDIVSTNEFGILKNSNRGGRMVVLRKR